MTDSLESAVDKEAKKRNVRQIFADTTAAVTFSWLIGSINDLAAGLDTKQWLKTRGAMSVANAILGRPYSMYRDFINRKMGVTKESGFFRRALADMTAAVTVYAPLYAGVLYFLTDAKHDQMMAACATQTIMAAVIGRPYGWYNDKMRGWFGAKSEYQK